MHPFARFALIAGMVGSLLLGRPVGFPAAQSSALSQAAPLANTSSADALPPTLDPGVQRALAGAYPNDRIRVIVRLKSPAGEFDKLLETQATRMTPEARIAFVNALQARATDSQRSILGYLNSSDALGQFDELRTYWIFNGLALRATPDLIRALAQRDDVESIRLDEWVQSDARPDVAPRSITATLRANLEAGQSQPALQPGHPPLSYTRQPLIGAQAPQPPAPGEVTWGVRKIRADQVWRGLGITGQGITVANIDSGVDWQHPALQSSYRGWTGGPAVDHVHNWFDATDEGAVYPSDPNGHGTHTMGTIVGQNGVGVAPGARWMAVKGLNSQGLGLYSWIHSAFQFILAPGGDPAFAPDVVNNSWSSIEGTSLEFKEDLAALERAGILAVFANGNRGPDKFTVGSPASLPGAVGVGATDEEDDVAYFSSRGPSPLDGGAKPVLSAPGVKVISTFPGGSYLAFNGTSMATPHVAGAAALVLSAAPDLSPRATLYALTSTARPLSSTVPNNDSGWGRVDAYDAVLSVLATGVIFGTIRDGAQPIGAANVIVRNESNGLFTQTTADAAGNFSVRVPSGIYAVEASAFGYFTATAAPRLVAAGSAMNFDLNLTYQPSGSVRGVVRDVRSGAYVTATVRALGTPKASVSNNNCLPCRYALDLPTGTYVLEARTAGYYVQTQTVTIADGALVDLDFLLTPTQRIAFVDSGAFYYGSAAAAYREAFDRLRLGYDEFRLKKVPADTPTITQLLRYDTVIWSAPFDAPGVVGASEVLSQYLAAGRNLMLAGQNIALYDGGGSFIFQPYFSRVNALYTAKKDNASSVIGAAEGPLAGRALTFTHANAAFVPDIVGVLRPDFGQLIGEYGNTAGTDSPSGSGAGVWTAQCTKWRTAYYAFGLEALDAEARTDVISRTLDAFEAPRPTLGLEMLSRDGYITPAAIGQPGGTITHVVRLRNTGDGGGAQTIILETEGNRWESRLSQTRVTLEPCATAFVTLTVSVPATAGWNAADAITLTGYLQSAPEYRRMVTFATKTPAGILLVDDERFSVREDAYLGPLAAQGNAADHWDLRSSVAITDSPSITTLRRYPIVIWFNGYDWFDPLKPAEESALQRYLDEGGRLFFSSQAALAYTGLSPFVRNYLGVGAIDYNDVTSNVIAMPGSALGDSALGGSLLPFPYNWNLSSAVQPIGGAHVILRGDSGQPFGLAHSRSPSPHPNMRHPTWRVVFMPFAFEALPAASRNDLMNRIIAWLSPLGRSSLVADRTGAQNGEIVNYTLTLRADDVLSPAVSRLAERHPVAIGVEVADGLSVIASTLSNASSQRAGEWQGEFGAADVITWTFSARVVGGFAAGTPLTATAHINIQDIGLRFTRTAIVRVNSPMLRATMQVAPEAPAWGQPIAATLRVVNMSDIAAPQATITVALPYSLAHAAAITATASTGALRREGAQLVWTGNLPARDRVDIAVALQLTPLVAWPPRVFHLAALVDDGFGEVTAATAQVAPRTYNAILPLAHRAHR